MEHNKLKSRRRSRRKTGIRKGISGTAAKPRLTVFRSIKHISAQVIDDLSGKTIVAATSVGGTTAAGNIDQAKIIGLQIAEKAKSAGVEKVAFDRNGFRYHGRVKALADAAREAGLKF